MIPVRRTEMPPVLKRNGAKWLKKLKEVKANPNSTKQQIDNAINKYNHPEVRQALINMFQGKCAYCESKIESGRIEHFKPKSEYIDLTFDWDNLLYSCEVCNDKGHKGNNFPIDDQGNDLLIDPTDENCDIYEHLDFYWDDNTLLANINPKDERGKIVQGILKLNRTDLRETRTKKIKQFLTIFEFAKTGNLEAIKLVREFCKYDTEYLAFVLFYIIPYFNELPYHLDIPELQKLVKEAFTLVQQVSERSPNYAQFVRIENLDHP